MTLNDTHHAAPPSTLLDVARQAGVSPSTVSRILNGTARVSDDKRDAVLAAIAHMKFAPNQMAQGLKKGRSMTIGIVVQDISSPFFDESLRGVDDGLKGTGYASVIVSGHWNAAGRSGPHPPAAGEEGRRHHPAVGPHLGPERARFCPAAPDRLDRPPDRHAQCDRLQARQRIRRLSGGAPPDRTGPPPHRLCFGPGQQQRRCRAPDRLREERCAKPISRSTRS